jgi:uncharacterized protein YkwD
LKRLRFLLLPALFGALLMTPMSANAAVSKRGDTMMDRINTLRANAGLRPLQRSRRLVRSSAARAELMMRHDFFAHPSQLDVPTFDSLGEVLAIHGGLRPRTRYTLRRWRNSAGHRSIVLSREFRWVGAARAVGRYNGKRATIWVVRFGQK